MTPAEFKILRKQYNLSQAEMAKRLGVSRLTIFNWEKPRYAMPSDIVAQLAKVNLVTPAAKTKRVFNITLAAAFYDMQRRELAADHQQAMAKVAEGVAEGSLQPFTNDDKLYLANKYDDILPTN